MQSERSIKLLRIRKSHKGRLIVKLIPTLLDHCPPYAAVSYVWGEEEETETHTVFINGCKRKITKNAYHILQDYLLMKNRTRKKTKKRKRAKGSKKAKKRKMARKRKKAKKRKKRNRKILLWMDAICINQEDNTEKSQQVQLMTEIYHKAAFVVIWLGNSSSSSSTEDATKSQAGKTSRNHTATSQRPTLSEILPELLKHEYWTRVWVVQEIVASRVATIFYAGHFYAWRSLVRKIKSLHNHQTRRCRRKIIQLQGLSDLFPAWVAEEKICQIDRMRRHYGKKTHEKESFLPYILMIFFSSKAKWEKDRVFAFVGISSAANHPKLKPNYSKEEHIIFKEVARYALQIKSPKLCFLFLSAGGLANNTTARNVDESCPSWAADLRELSKELPFPLWDFYKYRASGKECPHIRFLKSDQIRVEGVIVDRIRTVSSMKSNLKKVLAQLSENGGRLNDSIICTFFKSEWRRFREHWKIVTKDIRKTSKRQWRGKIKAKTVAGKRRKKVYQLTEQTLEAAFFSTLLCDSSHNPYRCKKWAREYGKYLLKLILAGRRLKPGSITNEGNKQRRRYFSNQLNSGCLLKNLGSWRKFALRLALSSFGRQFALTEKGYMALVVPGVRPGDEICIFSGARTPHALRRDEDDKTVKKYQLVGDVYLHGFMDGKRFNKLEKQHIIIK